MYLPCVRSHRDHCVLDVSVSPGAKRTELMGLHDGALRLRLAAPPVDGKANEALVAWLAHALGLSKRQVHLLRGQASRRKQLEIEVSAEAVQAWLLSSGLVAPGQDP